ncbi:MAG TPA: ParB/RepB/Spo0J family partition protein [Candidatus Paceibacterota bacterium]|nr:ParB/RepB/Spo0J family partition protein [Candidatus Paceibacterota bacterium]
MAFQGDSIFWVEVEKIVPNPFQPRREFDEQKLRELSESVRMYGILQPLTVTRKEIQREDGTFYTEYELIAGERRLRASKLAGLSQVPVIIREGEDSEQEKLELAIIENLQREDLNAVDRALAFRQLADVFGLSHTQVAKKVGRSREYVSNTIRLLALPDYMLSALRLAEMTEGHARTLLMLNDRPEEQDVVFREILLKKLSVREVERIVRKIATDKVRKKHAGDIDAELIEIEKQFMETLGTRVQIQKTDYGGRLSIDYFSTDELEEMLGRMKNERATSISGTDVAAADLITEHTPLAIDDGGRELVGISDEVLLAEVSKEEIPPVVAPESENPLAHASEEVTNELVKPDYSFSPVLNEAPVHSPVAEVSPVVAEVPVQPETVPSNHSYPYPQNYQAPTIAVPEPEKISPVPSEASVPVEVKKDDDDSGLYSIRNFSV